MTWNLARKAGLIAGLVAIAAMASAKGDVKIDVSRALNSPTLTIRYEGAKVALIELRLNGVSVGTRAAASGKASGEANFSLDPADLRDGDNALEILLYDKAGKLIGRDKQNLLSEQTTGSAVYLAGPKLGQTVLGQAEIKVGFNAELKNAYVSFFVDNNFKGMSNYPPYAFAWDTTREANGWHEVEAWAVDASSNTYKTRKIKVFVNNPGGRTDRLGLEDLVPATNVLSGTPGVMKSAGLRGVKPAVQGVGLAATTRVPKTPKVPAPKVPTPKVVPKVVYTLTPVANLATARVRNSRSGLKHAGGMRPVGMGGKLMTPTGTRDVVRVAVTLKPPKATAPKVAASKVTPSASATRSVNLTAVKVAEMPKVTPQVRNAVSAMRLLAIQKGTRIPNLSTFAVVYAGKPVRFDVAPRVDDGVPMSPFRHLFEAAGGEVKWENLTKSVNAQANGQHVLLLIGDPNAKVNEATILMEIAPYLDRGRTIVPLSFLRDALKVNVDFDPKTKHVLITPVEKKP